MTATLCLKPFFIAFLTRAERTPNVVSPTPFCGCMRKSKVLIVESRKWQIHNMLYKLLQKLFLRALELSIKSIVENPRVILTKEQQQDSANFSLPLINDQFVIRTFGHK